MEAVAVEMVGENGLWPILHWDGQNISQVDLPVSHLNLSLSAKFTEIMLLYAPDTMVYVMPTKHAATVERRPVLLIKSMGLKITQ